MGICPEPGKEILLVPPTDKIYHIAKNYMVQLYFTLMGGAGNNMNSKLKALVSIHL